MQLFFFSFEKKEKEQTNTVITFLFYYHLIRLILFSLQVKFTPVQKTSTRRVHSLTGACLSIGPVQRCEFHSVERMLYLLFLPDDDNNNNNNLKLFHLFKRRLLGNNSLFIWELYSFTGKKQNKTKKVLENISRKYIRRLGILRKRNRNR